MGLSYDLISEFVKITNDKKENTKEGTVYATVVSGTGGKYVRIDGSDLLTPMDTTTDIEDGERVTLMIKDHKAIVTGNVTTPSASTSKVDKVTESVNSVSDLVGTFELVVADFAQIKTLVNGNLTSDNILSFNLTSEKVTVDDAFIKDAMIDTISAGKINAGKINTNLVSIGSEDGGMIITGSTQQFTDKNGNVRIQIGKDASGDFAFILYGEDGQGQIINQNGITASAISDGLIVNDMVSDHAAISGGKLDISSVITEINSDNSTTIQSNKIYLNDQAQSLEVAFNSLKTRVDAIQEVTIQGDLDYNNYSVFNNGNCTTSADSICRTWRYPNGMQVSVVKVSGTWDITTAWGSIYSSPWISGQSFNIAFSEAPKVTINVYNASSAVMVCQCSGPTTTATGACYLWKPVAQTGTKTYIEYIAIGRWK